VFANANFYIDPTRIILKNTQDSLQLNIHNNSTESQPVQVTVAMLQQTAKNGQLIESNPTIMGEPQVVITPQVVTTPPKSVKPVRILALSQMDNDEIAYRVFIRSVSPRSITSNGTTMELGFGVPVYILPKNIIERSELKISKAKNNNYLLTISNTGNVHININSVTLFDNNKILSTIETPGAILSGKSRSFSFTLDKKFQSYTELQAEVKKQDLINYTDVITKAQKIKIN
jgi:P pilus assembly chaperone PapD